LILAFGGIPLIYNGDAVGVLNDYSYHDDSGKASDCRWLHRPKINWERADLRKKQGTVEYAIFNGIKKLIAIRKETSAFADFNNRELVDTDNIHLLCFIRYNHVRQSERVIIIANFDAQTYALPLAQLKGHGVHEDAQFIDLFSGRRPGQENGQIVLEPYQFYWLTEL
jgi:amylosucrase